MASFEVSPKIFYCKKTKQKKLVLIALFGERSNFFSEVIFRENNLNFYKLIYSIGVY